MTDNKKRDVSYHDSLAKLYHWREQDKEVIEVTFQVTEACSLACTYCYQHNKSPKVMTLDVAKGYIDTIFKEYKDSHYAIILDFIGGEPFLQPDLIMDILDYWYYKCIMENIQWGILTRVSICSNGTEYFKPAVQRLMKRLGDRLSFTVSIDGNKELHDSARLHHDGSGSYDEAIAAAEDFERVHNITLGSKMTIAPSNIIFLYHALKKYMNQGADVIHANCVYEEGWTIEDAKLFYKELKRVADYKLENYPDVYISLFEEDFFEPMDEEDNQNWCWGAGTPILTNQGYKNIEDLKIGDMVYTHTGELKPIINTMKHFSANTCEIQVSGAPKMICTKNHKLFVEQFDYLGNKNKKHFKDLNKIEVQNIGRKDLIHLFSLPENRTNEIDKNIAYLIGRFIGDGYITTQGGKSIVCSYDEANELEHFFINANIDYSIYDGKTTKEFHIIKSSKKENNILFNKLAEECGKLAENKQIPQSAYSWNNKTLKYLIQGYWAADGSINSKGQFKANTVSKKLANELMLILRTIGYNPTYYLYARAGKDFIQGREVNIQDRHEVYYYEDNLRSKYVKNNTTFGLTITDAEPQIVYNITVADNHSYVAGGIISANCGGTGKMLACDPDGNLYPCLRYMPSSLGDKQKPLTCGDVYSGLDRSVPEELSKITRRSQSTDECFYCPIAKGCSWCSAYNYEVHGTVDKRATFICPMHKARALANVYYWNKYYRQNNMAKRKKNHCPEEWALEIVDRDELIMLQNLTLED